MRGFVVGGDVSKVVDEDTLKVDVREPVLVVLSKEVAACQK